MTSQLTFRDLGIDTRQEFFVYMRSDCDVCVSEGFEALTRVKVSHKSKTIVATLAVLHSDVLKPGEISLSESARKALNIRPGATLTVSHVPPMDSFSLVRSKLFGHRLSLQNFQAIIADITENKYSNVHIAAFICACSNHRLSVREVVSLTESMIWSGRRLDWGGGVVVDKHCIGGLPGNRTTPLVVAIVAAAGLTIPKTSSRAITSPAGTADTVEVFTKVDLNLSEIRRVVKKEGGCLAWGGEIQLSPADEMLIRVERLLDLDSESQMIASILSKKIAAGSTHILIDVPVGPTAKVRSQKAALSLKKNMESVAKSLGITVQVMMTDGSQPVGRGIGPALEADDLVAVFQNHPGAPKDLRDKALLLAGTILEMGGAAAGGKGTEKAQHILESGHAWEKFSDICKAQGAFRLPSKKAPYLEAICSDKAGMITSIDNRHLAKLAKLTGAPHDKLAGIWFEAPLGKRVAKGDTLMTLHAESRGELDYALRYLSEVDVLTIE